MDIEDYIRQKKQLLNILLSFLENSDTDDFQNLVIFLQKNRENREELLYFLRLISNISNNHCRHHNFMKNVEDILFFIFQNIIKDLSNIQIFNIFKKNKLILLFLIEKQFLIIDEYIIKEITNITKNDKNFYHFFYPEIKNFIDENTRKDIENDILDEGGMDYFEEKRHIGENSSYLCSLIRNDSAEDFIIYCNYNKINPSSIIKNSIFETNSFLIDKNPTLIEYAAFYGSIQIFQYLKYNNVALKSSIWLYAIHSKNAELIHILEENEVHPQNNSYIDILLESIICFHNDFANYIKNNLIQLKKKHNQMEIIKNVYKCSFKYSNYAYFPFKMDYDSIFFNLSLYNYNILLNIILEKINKDMKIKALINKVSSLQDAILQNKIMIIYYYLTKKSEIDSKLFNNNKTIKNIIIPPSIKVIKSNAFNGCISLKKVILHSSIASIEKNAFYDCSSLEKIIIPSSVTSIEDSTFSLCTSLKKVSIPSSITSIGNGSFYHCFSLRKITIPFLVKSIGSNAFDHCYLLQQITISNSVKTIGISAFCGCESLKQIFIPNSVKSIGSYAFSDCTGLNEIIISSSVISIGSFTFSKCTSLIEITIPSSVTSIGSSAFIECESLKKVSFLGSVTTIECDTFKECHSLEQIKIPSTVTSIGENAFKNCFILKQINFPNSLTSIEKCAFYNCKSITKIYLQFGIQTIGDEAFNNCISLSQINLPNSIISIGYRAFYLCSLTEIYFPPSLKSIGYGAFLFCKNLRKITISSKYTISSWYIFPPLIKIIRY